MSQVNAATAALGQSAAQYAQNAQAANSGIQQFLQDCLRDQTDINEYAKTPEYQEFQDYCVSEPVAQIQWQVIVRMGQMLNSSDSPIQTLELAEGLWTSMQSSLQSIATQFSGGGASACAFLATLQLQTAMQDWASVGSAANAYLAGQQAATA